jgi:hypothetical protein
MFEWLKDEISAQASRQAPIELLRANHGMPGANGKVRPLKKSFWL